MKVLVVDDEISIRLLCRVNLEAEGFTIKLRSARAPRWCPPCTSSSPT